MGPCISVMVYHPRRKMAYGYHSVDPDWAPFFEDAVRTLGDPEVLEVYAAGANPESWLRKVDPEMAREFAEDSALRRRLVLELAERHGIRREATKVHWFDGMERQGYLILNVDTGRAYVKTATNKSRTVARTVLSPGSGSDCGTAAARQSILRLIDP